MIQSLWGFYSSRKTLKKRNIHTYFIAYLFNKREQEIRRDECKKGP